MKQRAWIDRMNHPFAFILQGLFPFDVKRPCILAPGLVRIFECSTCIYQCI